MIIEEMKKRKEMLGYSWERIAELSGLSVDEVRDVLEGNKKSPGYTTLSALEKVLAEKDGTDKTNRADIVREAGAVYGLEKRQGEYTLEDYYALPQDQRVELIDGAFFEMSSPTHVHQLLGGEIFQCFSEYIKKNKGTCIPAYAPLDVQLDCDDKTMVQPDVLIICDRDKFQRGVIYGAPDLIVEILSKSTRDKDRTIKYTKYRNAGVREYWLVDPEQKRVIVYNLERDLKAAIYGFDSVVPVAIFDGKCQVDFATIYEYVRFLYEKEDAF